MKYHVKVQGRSFEVIIENLHSQPVIANVDGEPVEVWVDYQSNPNQIKPLESMKLKGAPSAPSSSTPPGLAVSSNSTTNDLAGSNKVIRAPIPGTIISVAVLIGSEITIGQQLCVLEAMKMKNAIRSPRNGVIASVHVSPGQTVQHHDVLVEFVD